MAKSQIRKPNILDVFLSILIDPRGTTKQLFLYSGYPQWMMSTLLLFLAVVVVAPLMYRPQGAIQAPLEKQLAPVLVATILTLIITTFFVTMGLRSLRIRRSWVYSFAALIYATAPFISTLASLVVLNKLLSGDLTIISYLATGFASPSDTCASILPYALRIAATVSLIILAHAVCAFSRASLSVGFLIAISCIPLLLGSFIVAVTATEVLFPGSSTGVIAFFNAYVRFPA